jgi:hypothetical protein
MNEEKKKVYIDVLNGETGEMEVMEMDEGEYLAMIAWEAEYDAEQKKSREGIDAAYEYDRETWQYIRDDD